MEELDPNKLLPSDMVIEGVDDILFDIGLSLTSVRDQQKNRKFIDNPILLLTINTFMQATGMTKISRGGVFSKIFRPEGGYFSGSSQF